MVKRIKKHIDGVTRYYKRDGMAGVWYYLNHRLHNRIVKPLKHSDWLIPFSPERMLAKKYENTFQCVDDHNFTLMGNYYVFNNQRINKNSIVYSLGVLSDTTFDSAMVKKFHCDIYLFDPSNIARDHLALVNNPKFIFSQVGVWNKTCDVEFSTPKYGGSPSMVLNWDGKRFTHRCVDLKEIMEKNNHGHIELIKMDIEGAAFDVLNRMLDLEVYPNQIIAEFERPRSGKIIDYFQFYSDLIALNARLNKIGYQAFCMPRKKVKYFSIELIFVRFDSEK